MNVDQLRAILVDSEKDGLALLKRAEAAEAKVARLREALSRQGDNMAFILNNMNIPDQWYEKFTNELAEDRAVITF